MFAEIMVNDNMSVFLVFCLVFRLVLFLSILRFDQFLEMSEASTETVSRKVEKTALPIDEDNTLFVQNDFMIEPWLF